MTLAELAGKYLIEWPTGASYIHQLQNGCVYDNKGRLVPSIKEFASDRWTAEVTMTQYIAARDNIAIGINTKHKRNDVLEIAKMQFAAMTSDEALSELSHSERAKEAIDAAEAFLIEFNNRYK